MGRERYNREIAGSRKIYEALKDEGKDRPLSYHDWTTTQQAGGRLPYHKGAWFLHLLREQIGDDAFWRGLRIYTKDHWGKAVVSADFQKSMERDRNESVRSLRQMGVLKIQLQPKLNNPLRLGVPKVAG